MSERERSLPVPANEKAYGASVYGRAMGEILMGKGTMRVRHINHSLTWGKKIHKEIYNEELENNVTWGICRHPTDCSWSRNG
jgi:hypothetical protein